MLIGKKSDKRGLDTMQYRTLSNGVELPMVGYGTFQIRDAVQCEQCVLQAVETGYRLFDTAASYENEAAVGATLRSSGVPREEQIGRASCRERV